VARRMAIARTVHTYLSDGGLGVGRSSPCCSCCTNSHIHRSGARHPPVVPFAVFSFTSRETHSTHHPPDTQSRQIDIYIDSTILVSSRLKTPTKQFIVVAIEPPRHHLSHHDPGATLRRCLGGPLSYLLFGQGTTYNLALLGPSSPTTTSSKQANLETLPLRSHTTADRSNCTLLLLLTTPSPFSFLFPTRRRRCTPLSGST
jgi:hypothetical protein